MIRRSLIRRAHPILAGLSLFASVPSPAQTTAELGVASGAPLSSVPLAEPAFAEWLAVWSPEAGVLDSTAFEFTGSRALSASRHWVVADSGVTHTSLAASDVRPWQFSPDSTYAVCVFPGLDSLRRPMGEPDTQVQLRDSRQGSQRVILHCGTPCDFHFATWQSDRIVLVGGGHWDAVQPVIYRVDVVDGTVETFTGPSLGLERRRDVALRLWEFRTKVFPSVLWDRPEDASRREIRTRYAELLKSNAPLVLVAARSVFENADLDVLGGPPEWWDAFSREALMRLKLERERKGWDEMETVLLALPVDRARQRLDRMQRWISAYGAIRETAAGLNEFFESAIALTPETRPCFPRGDDDIQKLGANVGASLASGERDGLLRCMAARLSALTPEEEARMLDSIRARALDLRNR